MALLQAPDGDVRLAELPVSEHARVLLRLAALAPKARFGKPLNVQQPWFGKGRDAEQVRPSARHPVRRPGSPQAQPDVCNECCQTRLHHGWCQRQRASVAMPCTSAF